MDGGIEMNLIAGLIWWCLTAIEKYVEWMTSPIRIKGIVTGLYVAGTAFYFISKLNLWNLLYVSSQERNEMLLQIMICFILAFIAVSRVISGSIANWYKANERGNKNRNGE